MGSKAPDPRPPLDNVPASPAPPPARYAPTRPPRDGEAVYWNGKQYVDRDGAPLAIDPRAAREGIVRREQPSGD